MLLSKIRNPKEIFRFSPFSFHISALYAYASCSIQIKLINAQFKAYGSEWNLEA